MVPAVCHNKSGVAVKKWSIVLIETHSFGNSLNLVAQNDIKHVNMINTLDTNNEHKKKSPKREIIFKKFKDHIRARSPGIHTFSTIRGQMDSSRRFGFHLKKLFSTTVDMG